LGTFLYWFWYRRDLTSFPTRRSSDLAGAGRAGRPGHRPVAGHRRRPPGRRGHPGGSAQRPGGLVQPDEPADRRPARPRGRRRDGARTAGGPAAVSRRPPGPARTAWAVAALEI